MSSAMNRQQRLAALAELHNRISLKYAHLPAPAVGGADSGLWHLEAGLNPEADNEYFTEAQRILGFGQASSQTAAAPEHGVAETEHNQQGEDHMTDIRSTDPEATNHRKARFRQGWADSVNGKQYGARVLDRLTWQNTGWRLGEIFGETSDELIDQLWNWAVDQQIESPNQIEDDDEESEGDA